MERILLKWQQFRPLEDIIIYSSIYLETIVFIVLASVVTK